MSFRFLSMLRRCVGRTYRQEFSLGTAEDVAKAAVFLSTTDARWATGSLLTIDGGFAA